VFMIQEVLDQPSSKSSSGAQNDLHYQVSDQKTPPYCEQIPISVSKLEAAPKPLIDDSGGDEIRFFDGK